MFKDTVTIFKFPPIYTVFSNRWFHRDSARNVYFLSLTNNYWIWILLFWGQTWWVIPMTSLIVLSKDLAKNRKKWFSQDSINKFKFRLRICFYIINTSNVIFSDSPKPYRKVRKFTMDWKWRKMVFSRFWRRKVSLLHSKYYLYNCLERYFAFFVFSSHVTKLFDQEKIFL